MNQREQEVKIAKCVQNPNRDDPAEHLNLGMGSFGWPQMNAVSFDLTLLGIRSTSGVDSRPSGLISVHSTFEPHDRPHRTC